MFGYTNYHVSGTTVVGYAYNADRYGAECMQAAFGPRPGETPEDTLDRVAAGRGIDRSGDVDTNVFPHPIFASDEESAETCGRSGCGRLLIEH